MKRSILILAAFLVGGVPAVSADLARKAAPLTTVLPATDPFTGFYIGANVGYGFDLGTSVGLGPASISDLAGSPQGFLGGIQAGLGTRFGSFFYAGVEGDIDGAAINGTGSAPGLITANSKNSFLASIRGRFGLIAANNALIYGTVGWGFGGGQFSVTDVINGANTTVSPTMSGAVWGGGVELALTQNWLARLEYLQYDFGTFSTTMPATSPAAAGVLFTQKDRVDVVRAGLSYKF